MCTLYLITNKYGEISVVQTNILYYLKNIIGFHSQHAIISSDLRENTNDFRTVYNYKDSFYTEQ
jgi:hypothetical protein